MELMEKLLNTLVKDFNSHSELVALNYAKIEEGTMTDRELLQWNRGHMSCIRDYLEEVAKVLGKKIVFECGEHSFGYDNWKRTLEYVTARVEG